MKFLTTLTVVCAVAAGSAAVAKPALRDVSEIDDGLLVIGIADEIRKNCGDINARMIKALTYLNTLKARARALGYSDDEIEDYVTSKAEKRRMRARGEAYLTARGVNPDSTAELCAFGKKQISQSTAIGQFLR